VLPSADRTAGDTWHSAGTEDPDRVEVSASNRATAAKELIIG
jgi:hypothetical protein